MLGMPRGMNPPVLPSPFVPSAQGLTFNDAQGNNAALLTGILDAEKPGFHIFSAPGEIISDLMTSINSAMEYNLALPTSYQGPNVVSVISVTPAGDPRLATLGSRLVPLMTYPELSSSVASDSCTHQALFSYNRTVGTVSPFRRTSMPT